MPKVVNHEQYRKELLSQCFELFAQKGYASITMRQIAKELGVSTGTLYHYFPNKETLFEQLVTELNQQDIRRFAAEVENTQTLGERIQIAFEFVANNEENLNRQTLIWIEFIQQHGRKALLNNEIFLRSAEQLRQQLAELIGIKDRQVVIMALALIDGLLLQRLFNDDAISLQEQGILFAHMLTAYLEQLDSLEPELCEQVI